MRHRMIGLVWLAGCNGGIENTVKQLYPTLAVSPESLDFGEVGPPRTETLPVYVSNAEDATLVVTGELTGSPAFSLAAPLDLSLRAGEEATVEVTFTPDSFRAFEGELRLESNDAEHPTWVVPLTGTGVDEPFPDIDIEPSSTIEAPYVELGTTQQMSFQVYNRGDAPLVIESTELDGGLPGGDQYFSVFIDVAGVSLEPGQYATMVLDYTPLNTEGDYTFVHVVSNDPYEPDATVLLLANGGGEWDPPVAVIDCPAEVLLAGPEYTHLDGSQSYDPNGFLPLTYQWRVLERPEASDADIELDPDDTQAIDLRTDVAGLWSVELVVTNAIDTESEPTVCTFDAKPEDDLHVELSWNTPSADVDLHVRQGGSALFDVPEDCSFCNKNPDWATNSDEDDPRLDIDDQGGFGPENINVFHPEEGTYDVAVHYFAPHGDGPTTATVKVWLGGLSVFEGSRVLEDNDVWTVGTIDWPAALFVPDPNTNTKPDGVGCAN